MSGPLAWKDVVKAGDLVAAYPSWNRMFRDCQLEETSCALQVARGQHCASGVMLQVGFVGGGTAWPDYGWFALCGIVADGRKVPKSRLEGPAKVAGSLAEES